MYFVELKMLVASMNLLIVLLLDKTFKVNYKIAPLFQVQDSYSNFWTAIKPQQNVFNLKCFLGKIKSIFVHFMYE